MYEIDFLPANGKDGSSTKSCDAITIRFNYPPENRDVVIVIDGGYADIGDELVNHLDEYYSTNKVDLMISTHPDADHINGLSTAIQQLEVNELMIHQPRLHIDNVDDISNLEAIDDLLAFATDKGTLISEPFTGESRFGGILTILGPTESYYKSLMEQHIDEVRSGIIPPVSGNQVGYRLSNLFERALTYLPVETLSDNGVTGPRNNSSVITLLQINGSRMLLTGDAGIPALEMAASEYETRAGSFSQYPLRFFQAPHHGSKHNVGKTILNRILGQPSSPYSNNWTGFISSAKASVKHPSPKVTNALLRRGCQQDRLGVTNGLCKWHHSNDAPARNNWSNIHPFPILPENDDA